MYISRWYLAAAPALEGGHDRDSSKILEDGGGRQMRCPIHMHALHMTLSSESERDRDGERYEQDREMARERMLAMERQRKRERERERRQRHARHPNQHDSLVCMTRTFMCMTRLIRIAAWRTHTCGMTSPHVSHEALKCVTCHIHVHNGNFRQTHFMCVT